MHSVHTFVRICVVFAIVSGSFVATGQAFAGKSELSSIAPADELSKLKAKYEKKKKDFDKKVKEALKVKKTQPTKRKKKLEEVKKLGAELRAIKALIDQLENDANGEGEKEAEENSKTELSPYEETEGADDEVSDEDSEFDEAEEQAWDESEEESDESGSLEDENAEDFDEDQDDSGQWDDETALDEEL